MGSISNNICDLLDFQFLVTMSVEKRRVKTKISENVNLYLIASNCFILIECEINVALTQTKKDSQCQRKRKNLHA